MLLTIWEIQEYADCGKPNYYSVEVFSSLCIAAGLNLHDLRL